MKPNQFQKKKNKNPSIWRDFCCFNKKPKRKTVFTRLPDKMRFHILQFKIPVGRNDLNNHLRSGNGREGAKPFMTYAMSVIQADHVFPVQRQQGINFKFPDRLAFGKILAQFDTVDQGVSIMLDTKTVFQAEIGIFLQR